MGVHAEWTTAMTIVIHLTSLSVTAGCVAADVLHSSDAGQRKLVA